MTSGSTGRPVQTVGTALTQLFWAALTVRDHLWHERDFGRKLAVIRQFTRAQAPPEHGTTSPNWGSATDGVLRTGPAVALDIDRTVREQAVWLAREQPGYLLTYPSNVVALARHFSEHGADLPELAEVRTFGDSFGCSDCSFRLSLAPEVLERVRARDLWIEDRNFCTTKFLFGIAGREAFFVVRQHASALHWEFVGKRRDCGRTETGRVFEQTIRATNDAGEILILRPWAMSAAIRPAIIWLRYTGP